MNHDIISLEIVKKDDNEIKKKRLFLSWIMTITQFIAMVLQIIKYGTSGRAMVSGWTKLLQNMICGSIMVYLKWTSYDHELNNKFHLIIFSARRIILLGGFIFLIYTDSKNDFESFVF